MQAGGRRLLGEERERVGERRQLGRDLARGREGEAAEGAARPPVGHLVEIVRVRDHELAGVEREDVELDQVGAGVQRRPERAQRVLGRERGSTAVADTERSPATSFE